VSFVGSQEQPDTAHEDEQSRHRVRLPGFVTDTEIGLGDVIKTVTHRFGVKPCAGCEKRAASLNEWLRFSAR
jgi:hypothetical protein